jgi:hypothetical protein
MNNKLPDNWKEEMEKFTTHKGELRLLREGPKSWMEAMRLGALKQRYKKIMGYKEPEPKDCQSSFKEWNGKSKSL